MKLFRIFIYALLIASINACISEKNDLKNKRRFISLNPESSGITFVNKLTENDSVNYFNYGYIYMGGGVAIGDVNNDGLDDIYFTGNMVNNALYLNKGNLQFEDVSEVSKTKADNRWVTGVTMVDINADGWLDIYVSVSGIWTTTKNLLYINKGLNKEGIPIFLEQAEIYGIADTGNSTQSTFFDYDNDGDLDLYVLNYPPTPFQSSLSYYKKKLQKATSIESNTLYRNNGDGTFTDVSKPSGLHQFSLSLSVAVGDYNNDGWQDMYVSNDFESLDNFYLNNGDGTFTDQLIKATNQVSFYGMGTDVADINNDGLLDMIQLDMTPKDNRRSKANMQSMNIEKFENMTEDVFFYQYMQNSLQLNRGIDENGIPHFSNLSQLSGVAFTDWSWASLLADFDNDGFKDLFVTNGSRREINNKDFFNKLKKEHGHKKKEEMDLLKYIEQMPSEKIENYVFKNNGDITFIDVSKAWGLNYKGFSNGTAYADLDNDGDLDLVVNNFDEPSIVYKNTTSDNKAPNYVQFKFKGNSKNPLGIGTKVTIFHKENRQYQELMLARGFQSSVTPKLHFGLGNDTKIDSVLVVWQNGKQQKLKNVSANRLLNIDYKKSTMHELIELEKSTIFNDITEKVNVDYLHQENRFDDYYYQVLLPHKMSQFGPALATGDINNDGLDDFYIGGASGKLGAIYKQDINGTFSKLKTHDSWEADKIKEDTNAAFFDANNDGYLDLYVVSGGNEFYKNSKPYQDRLYINDRRGGFIKNEKALPQIFSSGSKVVPADYDDDGDMDLLIAGRHLPRNYPEPVTSFILRNDSNQSNIVFTDVTHQIAPGLINIGMVTDAVWTDYNNDNALDIVLVGEWMPLTFFTNKKGQFINETKTYGIDKSTGWWSSIIADDFDKDGDIDFVAGNLGLNYKYKASTEASFDIYADDFDNNKSLDIVLGYYNDGEQFPVRGRQCSSQQIPAIEVKFKDYNSFAEANLADVYSTQSLKEAKIHYKAYNFASSYIENNGDNSFKIKNLPIEAQYASINSILSEDVNDDGHLDLIVSGNLYASEAETPRSDASYGLYLEGDGKGDFKPIATSKSGLLIKGDVKQAAFIKTKKAKPIIAFAKNNKALQFVTRVSSK